MATFTNPIIDQEFSPKVVFYPDNKCAIFTCNGSPEGIITANIGSLALSDNGSVYKKTTDDVATGWIELAATASVVSPLVITGSNPTINFVDTDGGDDDANINLQTDILSIGIVGGTPVLLSASGLFSGMPKSFPQILTVIPNIAPGPTNLHSFVLPANSLRSDGDYLEAEQGGNLSGTNNTKTIITTFGGVTASNIALDVSTNGWIHRSRYTRINATTVRVTSTAEWGIVNRNTAGVSSGSGLGFITSQAADIAVTNLNANPQTILVTATAGANNDIIQNLSNFKLTQF
jgi:hypothetical protein